MAKIFKALSRQEHIKSIKLEEYATPYPENIKNERREIEEIPCDFRNAFIRDRDRIVHSASFRKLQDKTQIFTSELSPLLRNRLTHTLEVWQISVSIARMLKANIHLTGAIAYGHDLGHTPFGHAGESALNHIMKEMGLKGFSHNEQSVRVVSLLESPPNITPQKTGQEIPEWPNSVGLNLTYASIEGIFKHTDRFKKDCKDKELQKKFGTSCGSIEAQIVHIADDIAQNTHDLHDVWMAGAIGREEVLTICSDYPQFFGESLFNRGTKAEISPLIGKLIFDVVNNSLENLNNNYGGNPRKDRFINYSEEGGDLSDRLKTIVRENAILGDEVNQMNSRGRHIIHSLFELFVDDPYCLPNDVKFKFQSDIKDKLQNTEGYEKETVEDHEDIRVVCDYIASLTDKEAINTFSSTLI